MSVQVTGPHEDTGPCGGDSVAARGSRSWAQNCPAALPHTPFIKGVDIAVTPGRDRVKL